MSRADAPAAPAQEVTGAGRQVLVLLGLNALYIGFGLVMGVVNGGLPTVMRAQGIGIASAGWLYLLYLPFGLTFLWAPLVDRLRLPLLPQRFGWILAMQAVAIAAILIIAVNEGFALWGLFLLGLVAALAIATMDIALDALAVQTIAVAWRPAASATKLAALSLGAMLGGGAFVALFAVLGWLTTFVMMAAALALLLLPALTLARFEKTAWSPSTGAGKASLLRLLKAPPLRRRLLLLALACCVLFPLAGLNRLMLVDLGIPVADIGWIVGTLGPLAMLATSACSIPLMRYLGLAKAMLAFAGLTFLALAALGAGYFAQQQNLALAGAVLIGAGVSGIYVVVTAKIIGWAAGPQPATDYAAYYGIGRFASTLATVAAAQMVPLLGWGPFYGLGALALLVVVLILYDLIGRPE